MVNGMKIRVLTETRFGDSASYKTVFTKFGTLKRCHGDIVIFSGNNPTIPPNIREDIKRQCEAVKVTDYPRSLANVVSAYST